MATIEITIHEKKNSHFTFHGKKKGPITDHENALYHPHYNDCIPPIRKAKGEISPVILLTVISVWKSHMAFGTYWETKASFLNRIEAFLNFESVYETLKTLNCHHLNESYTEQCFSTLLRPPQTRKQCSRHIFEEKCFFKCFPVCTFVMETFFPRNKKCF